MSGPLLKRLAVTFTEEGVEFAVRYSHDDGEVPNPGTKGRTTTAARLARKGLEAALEGLDKGAWRWGGFGTNTRESEDRIISERSTL
jgi:hypothetical protein